MAKRKPVGGEKTAKPARKAKPAATKGKRQPSTVRAYVTFSGNAQRISKTSARSPERGQAAIAVDQPRVERVSKALRKLGLHVARSSLSGIAIEGSTDDFARVFGVPLKSRQRSRASAGTGYTAPAVEWQFASPPDLPEELEAEVGEIVFAQAAQTHASS